MVEMSSNELLNYAITNGMIDMNTIQAQIEMNERKKYLNMHNSKIWKSTDGNWYTYLQHDEERRLVKRKTEKALQDKIIDHYKQKENEPDIKSVFHEWIDRKLHYGEIQKQTYDRYLIEYNKYFKGTSFEKRKIKYLEENALEDFIMDAIKEHNLKPIAIIPDTAWYGGDFKETKMREATLSEKSNIYLCIKMMILIDTR